MTRVMSGTEIRDKMAMREITVCTIGHTITARRGTDAQETRRPYPPRKGRLRTPIGPGEATVPGLGQANTPPVAM
jgi:hypothetical protein